MKLLEHEFGKKGFNKKDYPKAIFRIIYTDDEVDWERPKPLRVMYIQFTNKKLKRIKDQIRLVVPSNNGTVIEKFS